MKYKKYFFYDMLNVKYKKVPNNDNAIEIDGKVVLSFDPKYKEYLKWKDENPDLEQQLKDELERRIEVGRLYNNGAPHIKDNIYTWYHDNGIVHMIAEMKDDKNHGEVIQYSKNGIIVSKENFIDGVLVGKYEYYHENGNLSRSGCIKDFQKDGEIKTYWSDGKLRYIESFVMGLKFGLHKGFYQNGNVFMEGSYKHNYRVGIWIWYWENGLKLKEKHYVNKILVRVVEWSEEGKEISDIGYNGTILNGNYSKWYKNGKKKVNKIYRDNKMHGKYIEWYNSGQKRSEGNMFQGMMTEKWIFWYNNGNKELECKFDFGTAIDTSKIYYDNGLLKEEVKL